MRIIVRCICTVLLCVLLCSLSALYVFAAKPAVTIEGLPNTIKQPEESDAQYTLQGYINRVYRPDAVWSMAEEAEGADISGAGILTVTPKLCGTYFTVKCTIDGYSAAQTVYIGEHSLIQGAKVWTHNGWDAGIPQNAVDGDGETFWDTGVQPASSIAKLCIDTNGVRYNKMKLDFDGFANSAGIQLAASEEMASEAPPASGAAAEPMLKNPVQLYYRTAPNYEKVEYISLPENTMKYLLFSTNVESAGKIPFQLNELSLFYTLPGDLRILGVPPEIEIPAEGNIQYRIDAVVYDTIGQRIDVPADCVRWEVTECEGVTFSDNVLTVESTAERGNVFITAVYSDGNTLLHSEKKVAAAPYFIKVYDSLMREVSSLELPGQYSAAVKNGTPEHTLIVAGYCNDTLTVMDAARADSTVEFYVDSGDNKGMSIFCWDKNQRPVANKWMPGSQPEAEKNVVLVEKNFANSESLSGFYRKNGSVVLTNRGMAASVDRDGIWVRMPEPVGESFVLDMKLAVNVPSEIYLRDQNDAEISWRIEPEDVKSISALVNREKNLCIINDETRISLERIGEIEVIGIRAQKALQIEMEYLRCYTGTRINCTAAKNNYDYFERTPVDDAHRAAKAAANNAVVMAVDYDTVLLYGDRVRLGTAPKEEDGVLYIPKVLALILGYDALPSEDYMPAPDLAELMGKKLEYTEGVLTIFEAPLGIAADSLRQVLYYDRPFGREILSAVNNLGARPRILANQDVFDRVADLIAADSMVKAWYEKIAEQAEVYLSEPVREYEVISGRLLAVSEEVCDRVMALGLVYKLTGEEQYAARAWAELENAAGFSDWHPAHFLDVGEMCLAFAIGYDWFYDYLTEAQKRIMVKAFEEKGLAPFVQSIRQGKGWSVSTSNWNAWIKNGVLSCVLSMSEDLNSKGAAAYAIERGMEGLEKMLGAYAPAGAWIEGTAYWSVATRFVAQLIDALEFSTGRYWGYDNLPGFSMTRYYSAMLTGSGLTFNFADTTTRQDNPPVEFWLADRFNDPALTNLRVRNMNEYHLESSILDLLWYVPPVHSDVLPMLQNDIFYDNIPVAAFHNGWEKDSMFAAVKGADTSASHHHFDGGGFVFDMGGQRFAYELGRDSYNITDDDTETRQYKKRAEGHNTLVINPSADPGQRKQAKAPITVFCENEEQRHAIIDLTPMYQDLGLDDGYTGIDIKRGFKVSKDSNTLLIQDEVHLTEESEMYWFMHTKAKIKISADARSAALTMNGITITARLLGDENAKFSSMRATPLPTTPELPGQGTNPGVSKLVIHWDKKDIPVKDTVYAVEFTLGGGAKFDLVPLADW